MYIQTQQQPLFSSLPAYIKIVLMYIVRKYAGGR